MRRGRRRGEQARRVHNRRRILEAAQEIFSRSGFHAARMDEIARLAGVAKGTLYYNYASKQRLFADMVSNGMDHVIRTVTQALESEQPFREHFRRLVEVNLELHARYRDLFRIGFSRAALGLGRRALAPVEAARERYVAFLADLLRRGQERGYLRPVDSRLAARAILGMLDSLSEAQPTRSSRKSRKLLVDTAETILASGLLLMRQ